ncbi:MAG: zinc-dependent metalloprotease, partial [Acidobacteriaceae bacterium]|nr:zinc-dependent metalloprotease [Acidobacteriaceae bacterium]
LYWDEHAGKMYMEIERFNEEFLYITALSAGVGSNDLGLDRGRMHEPKVVQFERIGPKILLIESNYKFRATAPDAAEQRSARDSFARSTLWGFEIIAEQGSQALVDATAFLLRDAAGVARALQEQKQGNYRVDESRSAFYLPLTKAFPKNTEVETTITFTGEAAGQLIREVTPSPDAVTVREHQGFVALPGPGYHPRLQDPRAGFFSEDFMDFSAAVDEPVTKRYIARHRLQKKDAGAAMSEPVEPLVYYIDAGAPPPVRSALLEGASWWKQAFEAAGFSNAFQVKVMTPDMDPMDVRYNVVQWVDRSTRGWSYGNSLTDPRSGEIIKGIVTLGSLRAHQDYLIFEGLMAPYAPGRDQSSALSKVVYARLRQLAAHEVGHTLGLEHNFLASTRDRASVMDYPGPRVDIGEGGELDLSHAYATGIGAWDKVAISWGYSQFPAGTDERAALDKIITDAAKEGLTFITDSDSRPPGGAHPNAHLWDNGPNAVDGLNHILHVRKIALDRFGENNIRVGAPMATLDEVLVPLYFLHRYQTEAAAKVLGGNEYTYALRGDGQRPTEIVPASEQRRALNVLLRTIDPATLTIPDRILNLIPPRPPDYPRTRETFPNQTGVTFDPIAGAEAAANLTVGLIVNSQRMARLEEYHARNPENPSAREVLEQLIAATYSQQTATGLEGKIQQTVQNVIVIHLLALAANKEAPALVRDAANYGIGLCAGKASSFGQQEIEQFRRNPTDFELPSIAEPPPGQPIGDDEETAFWPF